MRQYRFQAVLAPLFKMAEALMDLFVPVVVADIIDIGVTGNDMNYIVSRIMILVGLALSSLLFSFTAQYFSARASVGFAADVRQALFEHVTHFSMHIVDRIGSDTLLTRLTSDINQIQTGVNMTLRLLLRSPFIVFGSFIMALRIDVKAAVIFACAIPLLFAGVLAIMLVTIPMYAKVQKKLDHLSLLTRQSLTGVRVIRAFGREKAVVSEFDEANSDLAGYSTFTSRITALLNPMTFLIVNVATVILIYTGGLQVNAGHLLQGQVVALYNYMAQMIVELIKLSSLFITINKALACAGRVSDLLNTENDMHFETENVQKQECGTVVFDHVGFSYNKNGKYALQDISFTAEKGQTIGIIGGTGSGKTTLVSLLDRFYDIDEGSITIDGNAIQAYPEKQLRSIVSLVPQKARVFAGTIRDNLKMADPDADDERLMKAVEIAQATEVIANKENGLDEMLEQGGTNLSGGQRQRLTIARALVGHPEILILDDSASALDFATDARLRKAIRGLKDMTVFIVSQRIGTVKDCDQILVLDHGRLVGKGSHEQLLDTCEIYQEIMASQFPKGVHA